MRSCARPCATAPGRHGLEGGGARALRRARRWQRLHGRVPGRPARAPGAFAFEAWADTFASWRSEITRKLDAGQEDLTSELLEGRALVEAAAARANGDDRTRLRAALADWTLEEAISVDVALALRALARPLGATRTGAFEVEVDRSRARYGAWYELFPRSWGGLAGTAEVVPQLAELGFDVLYLPPIHPIGVKNRKGRNNAVTAGTGDPGSPWAIGSPEGGHTAIHPELGPRRTSTRSWRPAASTAWTSRSTSRSSAPRTTRGSTEHPEWFSSAPRRHAEVRGEPAQEVPGHLQRQLGHRGLAGALAGAAGGRAALGAPRRPRLPRRQPAHEAVRVLGVADRGDPRRGARRRLPRRGVHEGRGDALAGKLGFSQSYTYFTWKTSRHDLTEYLVELTTSGMQDYYRPNFFANTPDILEEYLQHGGRRPSTPARAWPPR
jgi:starch synthase (maltosyl-transferring)